jgi:hippurate hydrolase
MHDISQEWLTATRRALHRIPELDDDLPLTLAYLRGALAELGDACEVFEPCTSTLCAWFDRGSARATAIRADMDALPVTEATGVAYASTHPGQMHACGHDGHMTMVLALARWLADHADELPRSVLLVFQPAEETTGGAKRVCESGVFERLGVDRIFGFHLWPDLPLGQVATRAGALLASSNEVTVTMRGQGAHIAKWQEGRDALRACVDCVHAALDGMDALPTREPALLRFGQMEGGTVRNAIAAEAVARGSLRTFCADDRVRAEALLREVATTAAEAQGCDADVYLSEGYPAVTNDAALLALARDALPELAELPEPLLIAEDFAWYQQWIPGVFLLLGTGTGIPLHAATWDFDERVLARGLAVYQRLVTLA